MGQGGYLWIVNATSKTLKLTSQNSYWMTAWKFTDVGANSQECFYIEFDKSIFHTHTDDRGGANFRVEGACTDFQLQVRWFRGVGHILQVDWSGTDTSQFTVFPPPSHSSTIGKLGWIHNGSLCMLIQEKLHSLPQNLLGPATEAGKTQSSKVVSKPTVGTEDKATDALASLPDIPAVNIPSEAVKQKMASIHAVGPGSLGTQWMKYYSDVLGRLTLTEMTLPGTHNSGTYRPVSSFAVAWVRTQSLSMRDQLNQGIRVLDLRIGQNSPGNYIISHDTWRTQYSLNQALQEVTEFIHTTEQEIVILDFHRFNNLGSNKFDYEQLKTQVKSSLEGYYLSVGQGQGKTLSQIWNRPMSSKERIVVAWNDPATRDTSYMWPGVNQHWYSHADSEDKLKSDLETDFANPPPTTEMWSTCVFRTVAGLKTPYYNAWKLCPKIDNWFYGCASWTLKANIISTDFFYLFNNTVQASICASILKSGMK